ncbi:MAG: dioxygenase [Nevskiaceae bacterium]|nr:MAG: dioxygenase [Nevskiaceae bacterium]
MPRYRSLFLSHGAPTLALDTIPAHDFLKTLGATLPRPSAIVAVSPHWMAPVPAVKTTARYRAWHDFGGFPDALYQLRYAPAGDAARAQRIAAALQQAGIDTQLVDDERLDHGVWVPLMLMFPQADVPVIHVASLGRDPAAHYALGRALADGVDEEVLILGSGGAVHNLRALAAPGTPPQEWALSFDDWLCDRLLENDREALLDYRRQAPGAAHAHPTEDHLMPLFVALGAAHAGATTLHRSFSYGNLSMACYGFA